MLVWDEVGTRYYETGVSKGIFFPIDGSAGVPWNGLVSVNLESQGGESESYWFDGIKYMDRVLAEDFQGTVQALSTPREFEACEGVKSIQNGLKTHFNKRDKFHMAWRTEIGSDSGQSVDYKIHIAYNCLVQPSARSYQTISDNTTPDLRSFVITTTPACGRDSYFTYDSREGDLSALEARLYAGDLPKCWELSGLGLPPGGGGGGGSTDPDLGCAKLLEDFESFIPGQVVVDDVVVDAILDTQITDNGLINNGLDITVLPAVGAYAANDSAASEVGTGDILADGDDATYITSADGDLGYTVALPPLVGYVEGCALELHIRMSITGGVNPDDPDNLDADAQVHISTDATGDINIGGFSDGEDEGMGFALSDVDGNPVDYVVPLAMNAWVDTTIADVIEALEAGAYLNVVGVTNNNTDTTPEVRVYEASVVMLNGTDQGLYLRPVDQETQGSTELLINDASSPMRAAHTSYVDFELKEITYDPASGGDVVDIMSYEDSEDGGPALIRLELDVDGNPILSVYEPPTVSPTNSYVLETNVWYRAQLDVGWESTTFKLVARNNVSLPLMTQVIDSSGKDPLCQVTFHAGFYGVSFG